MKLSVPTLIALVLGGCASMAIRDFRDQQVNELVSLSEVIFVGTVNEVFVPDPELTGVTSYAIVAVNHPIFGTGNNEYIQFVVEGFSAELDQDCCRVGSQYLFFGRHGYGVFDFSDSGEASVIRRGVGRFVSASDSRRRVFRIDDKRVCGWGEQAATGCEYDVSQVLGAIDLELARSTDR